VRRAIIPRDTVLDGFQIAICSHSVVAVEHHSGNRHGSVVVFTGIQRDRVKGRTFQNLQPVLKGVRSLGEVFAVEISQDGSEVQAGHSEKPHSEKNQSDKNFDQRKPSLASTRFLSSFRTPFPQLILFHAS